MAFSSVLFCNLDTKEEVTHAQEPAFFIDLNMDQIVTAITAGRDQYNLKPYFHVPLKTIVEIEYRQAIVRDLQTGAVFAHVNAFAETMHTMREQLKTAEKAHYARQKQRWLLEAMDTYGVAVGCLARDLNLAELHSEGLQLLREYLAAYVASPRFAKLVEETHRIKSELARVQYRLHIEGLQIEVSRYDGERDYSELIAQTFEKFRQNTGIPSDPDLQEDIHMNHVEAEILDRVAHVFPEIFTTLEAFCTEQARYLDPTLQTFDREVQFYVAILEMFEQMKSMGLLSSLPTVTKTKELRCHGIFDLALAIQMKSDAAYMVLNEFYLQGAERIMVVSGANQGGKTTFARTVGQLHYMASLGCPIAAADAQVFLFDQLFTHFEREENLQTQHSKLEDDLVRIHEILERSTSRSLLIMNESFSSATLQDALLLGRKIIEQVIKLDLICVFVTFLDELSVLGEQTVSMVSTVAEENAVQRTFKIVRRPADGLAYAAAIAEKYHLTYNSVTGRIAQ